MNNLKVYLIANEEIIDEIDLDSYKLNFTLNCDQEFKIKVEKPIGFSKSSSTEKITRELNIWLEKTILKNPGEWIWSHDRWK